MTLVQTTSGPVRGALRDGIATWRGIPYARAPRFRRPEPVEPWIGELDATKFGPFAMQSRDPRTAMMSGVTDKIAMSEDCLVLNIYAPAAPAAPGARRCPVLVWIHGGAFVMGAGSQPLYNGTSFCREHDLVVVTLNYRLGLLGLLYLGDLLGEEFAPGNVALLDQVAALRWVRDNIAAFGGDPDNVTVMGESAGSISVAHLLAMPEPRGLFHRAILQSGATGLQPISRADVTAVARSVCEAVGVTPRELLTVPAERLIAAQQQVMQTRGLAAWMPYVDGVTVPRPPLELVREGAGSAVPTLLGSNRDEWTLFDLFLGEAATGALRGQLRGYLGEDADRYAAIYREARGDGDERRAWLDMMGDVAFRIPMIHLAEAQARHAPVFMYRFDWATPAFDGRLGATHALELPFVWNTVDSPFGQILLGGDPSARPLATLLHAAWSTFARTGVPAAPGLPAWPRYEEPRRATLLVDRVLRIEDDPGATLRRLWA